jgi:hypothetical protein
MLEGHTMSAFHPLQTFGPFALLNGGDDLLLWGEMWGSSDLSLRKVPVQS